MEVIIKGEAKEIAVLVLEIQGRQMESVSIGLSLPQGDSNNLVEKDR